VMDHIAPTGPVYQAGTLSGNPIAMTAGLATLALVAEPGFHERLAASTSRLTAGIVEAAASHGIALSANEVGGMFGLFFTTENRVRSFRQVMACDQAQFKRFFHRMLDEGVYLAPSAFEAGFVSSAHGDAEIEATIEAADRAFAGLTAGD